MSKPVDILLVEDTLEDIELTLHAFRKNQITNGVQVVRDGEEALEYLFCTGRFTGRQPEQPRLILLDLKLPKVDGLEVLQKVKTDQHTKMIPVVVLTSSGQECDIVESYRLGVNSYIRKPVDFQKFNQMVQQLGNYWLFLNEPAVVS